jgi:hypothetical protein
MKRALLVVALVLASRVADAEPHGVQACFAAAVDGQKLRNGGKLRAARAQLIMCSKRTCPGEVSGDCIRWLAEVEQSMPTVVFAANDEAGADLLDVRVDVDGALAGTAGDGRPVDVDPGTHEAIFTRPDGTTQKETFVARAGEKNRTVVARFVQAPTPPPPPPPPPSPAPAEEPRRSIPTATWALGGVGVVALGVFGAVGAVGVSQRSRLGCDVGCSASDKSSVDSKFLVADVALGIGVVAIAAAVAIYLIDPR